MLADRNGDKHSERTSSPRKVLHEWEQCFSMGFALWPSATRKKRRNKRTAPSPGQSVCTERPPIVYGGEGGKEGRGGKGVYAGRSEEIQISAPADLSGFWSWTRRLKPVPALTFYIVPFTIFPLTVS